MGYETLLIEKKGGIGKIILNRPKVLNAMNTQMIGELDQAFTEMEQDDEVQVVVLTGSGRSFSTGRDMREIDSPIHRSGGSVYANAETLSKPVIAAVNGPCYTGGLELMLCADLAVASENAVFADTHARYGRAHGGGGSQRLRVIVGLRRAEEIMLTSEPINAFEAERIGLVNKVVPPDKLDEAVEKMARKIMQNSQESVRREKWLVHQGVKWGLGLGLELETRENQKHQTSAASRASIDAFLNKK